MRRITSLARVSSLLAAFTVPALAPAARGQTSSYDVPRRAEFTPFGSYQWGGSFDTDAISSLLKGKITENSSFSWGALASFVARRNSAAELFYLRQATDVDFNPDVAAKRTVGDFVNNYIQLGVRQDVPTSGALHPFITASAGVNILDPKAGDLGTSTRFAWSLGGGARYMVPNQRVGVRFDLRWMVTPVPSGTYAGWCDAWGCFAAAGTTWLNQGQVGGGLVFAF